LYIEQKDTFGLEKETFTKSDLLISKFIGVKVGGASQVHFQ